MLLPILEFPDPRLRKVAARVGSVTPEIERLVLDMAETMYAAPGVGLAATQCVVAPAEVVIEPPGGRLRYRDQVLVAPIARAGLGRGADAPGDPADEADEATTEESE